MSKHCVRGMYMWIVCAIMESFVPLVVGARLLSVSKRLLSRFCGCAINFFCSVPIKILGDFCLTACMPTLIFILFRIREECEKFGICTIVPPEEWRPPFAIDIDASAGSNIRFDTKEQRIDTIQVTWPIH